MLELFPEGFEEVDAPTGVELAAYTDAAGEERLWAFFGSGRSASVEDGLGGQLARVPPADPRRAASGSARRGRRRRPTRSSSSSTRAARSARARTRRRSSACRLLQELEPGPLLDVGCGSGVLSIAAALLGFEPVVARRRRGAVDRGDARERGSERRHRRRAPRRRADETLPGVRDRRREHLARVGRGARRPRLDSATLVTSGYSRIRRAAPRRLRARGAHDRSTAGPATCTAAQRADRSSTVCPRGGRAP